MTTLAELTDRVLAELAKLNEWFDEVEALDKSDLTLTEKYEIIDALDRVCEWLDDEALKWLRDEGLKLRASEMRRTLQ